MFSTDAIAQIVQAHGLLIVFLLAIIEGPIVTVIAAYFAHLGYLGVYAVYLVCVLADLVGDTLLYLLGRSGPQLFSARWRARLRVDDARLLVLEQHFRARGARTLVIGKLTHSAGMLVLLAAGASRMRFLPFLWYNLLGTVPKTLLFVVLGFSFGAAYKAIDSYILRISLVLLVVGAVGAILWLRHKRKNRPS